MTFSGTITSDFMKLVDIPLEKRATLINFASTDFLSIRSSLLQYARAVYPNDYQYFVESDLGIMFIELVAYLGSVLSMKADMLANENFISTARQRSSVKKLLNLIGVRMKGPLSSAAEARLTLNSSYAGYTAGQYVTLSPGKRTITVTSQQDAGPVTFTLYKVVNGLVDLANANGNIVLEPFSEGLGPNKNVFQNLVLQEGSLVTESGSFTNTQTIKTIRLNNNSVIDGSVQVYITDPNKTIATGNYEQVDNIYFASGLADRIFQVNYDDDYNATIVFGDGTVGISPSNESTYFIQYRVGGGTRGNIPKSLINASIDINGVVGVITNTSPGTGGSNAETIEHAKKYAPLTFRRQDRLVTLVDYSTFANSFISKFGSIGKATAVTRKAYSSANVIDIYILEKASDLQLQRATTNFKTELLNAMSKKKMATDDLVIVDGLIRTIDLVVTARVDRELIEFEEQIKAKIRDKVLEYLSVDNMEFGEDFIISELNRKIFEIDEVRFCTIDNLDQDIKIDFNEIIQLNNLTINIEFLN